MKCYWWNRWWHRRMRAEPGRKHAPGLRWAADVAQADADRLREEGDSCEVQRFTCERLARMFRRLAREAEGRERE